jgi:protein TonB
MNPTSFFRVILLGAALLLGSACFAQDSKFDEPPMPTKTVPPIYPSALKRDGISGMVTMSITVDETGSVLNPVVKKSTRSEFEQPALDAVLKWKFSPAKKDGKPVAVQVVVPVKFSVD